MQSARQQLNNITKEAQKVQVGIDRLREQENASSSSIDLATVTPGKAAVAEPVIQPPVPVAQQQFVDPTAEPVDPVQAQADAYKQEAEGLQNEVATLEQRMANTQSRQNEAYDAGGVYDDAKQLNEAKARLQELQDRQVEIQVEAKQELRGRGATKTDFNNLTGQPLEDNALSTLAQSRAVSRLSDAVAINQQIINDRLEAENTQIEFEYEQKTSRLNSVTAAHADIMTAQEEAKAEALQRQYDTQAAADKAEADLRSDLLLRMVDKGYDVSGFGASTPVSDLLSAQTNQNPVNPINWSTLDRDTAFSMLANGSMDKASYDAFIDRSEFADTLAAEEQAERAKAEQALFQATKTVEIMDELLGNKSGLNASVGPRAIQRSGLFRKGAANSFESTFANFVSEETLNQLVSIKERGATLGAVSNAELDLLGRAATDLGIITTDEGKPTGKSSLSQSDFRERLNKLRDVSMKVYVGETLTGTPETIGQQLDNMSREELRTAYDKIKADGMPTGSAASPDQALGELSGTTSQTTASFIAEEEGFRRDAYQDQTGTWTIGFGSTQINGRPVQPGDSLNDQEADALFQKDLARHSTFKSKVSAPLTEAQATALHSFEFNLGPNIWDGDGAPIIAAINAGQTQRAAQLMQQFTKSKGQQLPVLVARRQREANLLLS